MPSWARVVLIVLGLLAVVAGIICVVEPVHSMPSFFPGSAALGQIHHYTRGYIATGVGVILLIIAVVPRRSRRRAYR
jgi:hypothetical protein